MQALGLPHRCSRPQVSQSRARVRAHAHASSAVCTHEAKVLDNKSAAKATQPAWRAGMSAPGQLVDVKLPDCEPLTRVIASSPSRTQQESTKYVDQTLIDVLAEDTGPCSALYGAQEGAALLVSDVHGTGFSSVMYPDATIAIVIEEKRPLLIVADGAEGVAGARALLEWEPCEAMATEAPVVLVYMAPNGDAAPFAERADAWRERGMTVASLFVDDIDKADASEEVAEGHLATVELPAGEEYTGEDWKKVQMWDYFFRRPDIQRLFGGKWQKAAAVFSGLHPAEAKAVLANLTANGVHQDYILQR